MPAPFWNDPPTYRFEPMICRASTLPPNAGPFALQNGAHLVPSQTARKSAFGSPPALVKEPPANTRPPLAAIANTSPPSGDAPKADHLVPSHLAMLSASGTPPASVKPPPTRSVPGCSTWNARTGPLSAGAVAIAPVPRWPQVPATAGAPV